MCTLLKDQNITFNHCGNWDGLKHQISPVSDVIRKSKANKAIFVYSDFVRSIYSHYRRHWAQFHFKNLAVDFIPKTFPEFVMEFDKRGYDISGIERQILNWRFTCPFPVLFIDFAEPIGSSLSNFVGRDVVLPTINETRLKKYDREISTQTSTSFKRFYEKLYKSFKHLHGNIYMQTSL